MLIDSHCHLEKAHHRGDLAAQLDRAAAAGVEQVINVGTKLTDWSLYQDLARQHRDRLFYTVGLHPGCIEEDWEDQLMALGAFFVGDVLPVGLGEIGLDHFHLPKFPDEAAEVKARQGEVFRHQLTLALQFDCPVVIHSRNAVRECVQLIDESGIDWAQVVFHCWSDGPEEIDWIHQRGGRASFTGIVTYKSAENVRQAALAQGLGRIMVETDAPYLTPEPHRKERNEPAQVVHTARRLAQEFGIHPDELAEKATRNTRRFFGLPKP